MNRIEVSLQLVPYLLPFVYLWRPKPGRLVVVMQDGISQEAATQSLAAMLTWEERDAIRAATGVPSMSEDPTTTYPEALTRLGKVRLCGGRYVSAANVPVPA